jgi:hypothetical protein
MGALLRDLRVASRALRRTPAFPLAAIATLAIGIGATTAIFSTVNAALLKPLPYPNASDLYSLRTALIDGRVTTGNLSPVEILRLNDPDLPIVRAVGMIGNDVTLLRDDGTPIKTRARLSLIGATCGVIVAYVSGRIVSSQLYEVRASDPMILAGATIVVASMALVASVIPAFRASRLDPARVLRAE